MRVAHRPGDASCGWSGLARWVLPFVAGLAMPSAGGAQRLAPPHLVLGDSGPVIVVLHGGPGLTHDYLLPEWGDLADNARLILYDQLGCGRGRPADSVGLHALLSELGNVIDRVSPDEPVVLAGSSWGGRLAGLYALRDPERVQALVLAGLPAAALDPPERARAGANTLWSPRDPVVRIGGGQLTEEQIRDQERIGEIIRARSLQECPEVGQEVLPDVPFRGLMGLRDLDIPVLLAADDLFGTDFAEAVRSPRSVPDTRIVLVEGGGHDPWFTHRDLFFEAVRSFLKGPVAGGGS